MCTKSRSDFSVGIVGASRATMTHHLLRSNYHHVTFALTASTVSNVVQLSFISPMGLTVDIIQ